MDILIIDDDPFAIKLLRQQLNRLGFKAVTQTERAADALVLMQNNSHCFDMIFCDLQMPEMDGIELVRNLAEIGSVSRLVLVTGEDKRILQTAELLAKAHGLAVVGALNKPVSPQQLRQVFQQDLCRLTPSVLAGHDGYRADRLRQAIVCGELENFYQPKLDLTSGKLMGVETLVRWHHPEDGLIYPDQFIPLAEQYGLIDALTQVVLNQALHHARQWRDAGLKISVAVNVSMANLSHVTFPDRVVAAANKARFPLTALVLEVTESKLMSNQRVTLDILTRLRLKRINLSIDDFGTGHSSLVQLHDLPFNELKIDKGFVHGACRDNSLRAIFEGSLEMARKLGMKTVAEGIEDSDDWNFLLASSCDTVQGFYIAKPMRAEELLDWHTLWTRRLGK
ncbi:EAL domain-containing response regulator [Shewanella sp. AS16]|uniref:EAL domain-containing response regulator n=1 Tax=Shewanella sp. AS16 TaxID=2907625 RepID=UPI001F397480|nr:EAL domain-containing response regulator [Shewanella sp. AS16]MCE9688080.1 EAL domain-containing response regulator [Shewanella sp. AS16]